MWQLAQAESPTYETACATFLKFGAGSSGSDFVAADVDRSQPASPSASANDSAMIGPASDISGNTMTRPDSLTRAADFAGAFEPQSPAWKGNVHRLIRATGWSCRFIARSSSPNRGCDRSGSSSGDPRPPMEIDKWSDPEVAMKLAIAFSFSPSPR